MDASDLPEKEAKVYEKICKKYKVGFDTLKVRDCALKILQVEDLEPLLVGKDPFADVADFPFWVRLWESAIILSDVIASLPGGKETKLLELGAGLGAPGLFAAAHGYQVTLSDYEPHILDFQRVSAAVNGLNNIEFRIIDWNKPPKLPLYDKIIGAEILFRKDFFAPLLKIFRKFLAPGGEIYLAHDVRRKSLPAFLNLAEKYFEIAFSTRKIKDEDSEITIIVNRLRPLL
ncbi:MAG: methyltransferase domain-containing protein [Proteobacteria bacterium]|nr:methyltransferase domain-containing protein [Pseudomonadota bacterium]MBU1716450.1 methyltransferase domain-containing protein [Pseudomonadota bacterium]